MNTQGIEAKTDEPRSGIGIEERGPVVELLPEHNVRVAQGFIILVQGAIVSLGSTVQ